MNTTPNLRTTQQNRHLHWLFNQLGVTNKDAIAEIVWDFTGHRTNHTGELSFIECMNLINTLNGMRVKKQYTTSERIDNCGNDYDRERLDKKRKGVIKAIFRWFELRGKQPTMEYVKGVACRAAGVNRFNEISESALTRIYAEFCKKQRTVEAMHTDDFEICLN